MTFLRSLFLGILSSLFFSYWLDISSLYACVIMALVMNAKMLPLGHTVWTLAYSKCKSVRNYLLKSSKCRVTLPLAQIHLLPARKPPQAPPPLFDPSTVSSHACILECDVYIHKSNSTYLLDLDVSRMKLVAKLLAWPLRQTRSKVMLAGVDISYRREIPPLRAYDTRSCILTWDRKWIYVVSYHIPSGAVIENGERWVEALFGKGEAETAKNVIFAVAISKFVAKDGRRTIPPAQLLELGGFINAADSGQSAGNKSIEERRALGMELLLGK